MKQIAQMTAGEQEEALNLFVEKQNLEEGALRTQQRIREVLKRLNELFADAPVEVIPEAEA